MRLLKGFDISQYPGDNSMRELRASFDFCNVYLGPAPSHRDDGWMDKRQFLYSLGYSIAVIYVGQQTMGPGSHVVTAEQGAKDALDCAALMVKAGFAKGDPVYLDLENGPPLPDNLRAYALAWIDGITAAGYRAGIYGSYKFISEFDSKTVLRWAFKVPTTSKTSAVLPVDVANPPSPLPLSVALQYRQNVQIVVRSKPLVVDFDVAIEGVLATPPAKACT